MKNSFYNLFGGIIRLILGVLSVPLLLQWLGAKNYGLYTILVSIINFALVAEGILPIILTVFLSDSYAANKNSANVLEKNANVLRGMFWFVAGLSIIISLLLWALAPVLSNFFDYTSYTERYTLLQGIRLSSLLIFTRLLQQYFVGIEQANALFKLYNIVHSIFGVVQTIAILIAVYFTHSVIWAINVQLIISFLFVIIHIYACQKYNLLGQFRIFGKIDNLLMSQLLKYSYRAGIGLFGSLLFSQGDRIIVAKLLGFEKAGIYSAFTSVVSQINFLSGLPTQPIVSEISMTLAEKEKNVLYLSSIIRKALTLNVLIAVSLGGSALLMIPELLNLLFSNSMTNISSVIVGAQLVTIIYTLYSLNATGFYILFATKQEMYNSIFTMVGGIVVLVLIYLLSPSIGLLGAFLGNAGYLITLYLTYKGLNSLTLVKNIAYTVLWKPLLIFAAVILISYSTQMIMVRWASFVVLNGLILFLFVDAIKPKLKFNN